MAERKRTPDILGELLGGSRASFSKSRAKSSTSISEPVDTPEDRTVGLPASIEFNKSLKSDAVYFESIMDRAASALVIVAEVLGRERLVDWLTEMKEFFNEEDEGETQRMAPGEESVRNVASWLEKRMGAESTIIRSSAKGLNAKIPYEVDIWAHFRGERFRSDLDMWIECYQGQIPIKKKTVLSLVQKATDVYHRVHTNHEGLFFDRLMIVSSAPFDPDALAFADQCGVVCVLHDGSGYRIQTEENWKLKPRWFRDAEAVEDFTKMD